MLPRQQQALHRRPPPSSSSWHLLCTATTLLIFLLCSHNAASEDSDTVTQTEGKEAILACPVSLENCGPLHSLYWFKGDKRIAAMLLEETNATNVIPEYEDRFTIQQNPFNLIIRDLRMTDEDVYYCDKTFFIPRETCENFNAHRIELNVLVPPSEIVILDEKGNRLENGSKVGPMQERQLMNATCVVRDTRPMPQMGWWRGNKRLVTHSPTYESPTKEGLYTATLELSYQLSRDDLEHNIECRIMSSAIPEMKLEFDVDLHVSPTSITMKGVELHTVQGSTAVLTCDVHGARPAVDLTWYNGSRVISPVENGITTIKNTAYEKWDGTIHTRSDLSFNATRFENDVVFRCEADNIVLRNNGEKPLSSSLTLEVWYSPVVVSMSPLEATVNSSDRVLLNCEYEANPATLTKVEWYRNNVLINVSDSDRYVGVNSENIALEIRHTTKEDIGNYTCQLTNNAGKSVTDQQIELNVQYVPVVEVLMIPEGPVKESDESNVTLYCNILDANPTLLTKVRWYANATLLKELPDCHETGEDLCHIDPSKLLLESIGRGFFYNYSCEGLNAAGWGPRSEERELVVHYEPGPANLTNFPMVAVKKDRVVFTCSVDDPGFPEATRFRWMRGGRGPLSDLHSKNWMVEPVGLDSRTNYSCFAYNEGGKGQMATVNLEVHAPPDFIKSMPQYTGILHSTRNANLTCRVECVPRCNITWLIEDTPVRGDDKRFFIKDKYMDASPATGDFESMLSVLHFNMSNWPNKKFDFHSDNVHYTCLSTNNTVGPGVKSTTYLSIEYAPDNTTVSEQVLTVQEDTLPERVTCKSEANPTPKYEWHFKNKTVIEDNVLIINTPLTRNDTGRYTCLAFNKHGRSSAEIFIDVQYKPRCEIERREINDEDTLICTAYGNPDEADFSWSIKAENAERLGPGDNKGHKDKSYLVLEQDYAIARTYRCVANNTVGPGSFCEIEVSEQLAWWQRWDKTAIIILVASILVLLLAVIIICCIIICICRRRRRQDKYHTDVSISATHSVLSYQPTTPQVGVAMPLPMQAQVTGTKQAAATTNALSNIFLPTLKAQPNEPSDTHATSPSKVAYPQANSTAISTHTNTLTTTTATITPAQAPKSPPRWPLRPGVRVYLSSETKENLALYRSIYKPNSLSAPTPLSSAHDNSTLTSSNTGLNVTAGSAMSIFNNTPSTAQTSLLSVGSTKQTSTLGRFKGGTRSNDTYDYSACQTLPLRGTKTAAIKPNNQILTVNSETSQQPTDAEHNELLPPSQIASPEARILANRNTDDIQVQIEPADGGEHTAPSTDPVITESKQPKPERVSLKRMEKFLSSVFRRTKRNDTTRDSQRSHVGLLEGVFGGAKIFWKRTENNEESTQSPFAAQHRLKGIRCSGSVTYKKSPVSTTSNAAAAVDDSNASVAATENNNHSPEALTVTNNNTPPATQYASQAPTASDATPGSPRSHAFVTFRMPSSLQGTRAPLQPQTVAGSLTSPNGSIGSSSQRRGILKSPTPPPRPPPPLPPTTKRNVLAVSPTRVERVQIQDKSSSLGDPLTEPGEYENLPFHGLQTAPNKFATTTPTNFNNNTNVVRVVPRPKRVNGNISQMHVQQHAPPTQQRPHAHQQQYKPVQHQQPTQAMNSHSSQQRLLHHMTDGVGLAAAPDPHQITYNLNNCFPKSYTEYYHQQQQQQQLHQKQKYELNPAANAQILNAIEPDYPAYAVVERHGPPHHGGNLTAAHTNPFLAFSNFKKYDTDSSGGGGDASGHHPTGSMHRNKRKTTLMHKAEENKKFYSLKFSGGKHKAVHKPHQPSGQQQSSQEMGLNGSLTVGQSAPNVNKCKRHHSFAGGSIGDIDSEGTFVQQPQQEAIGRLGSGVLKTPKRFYDAPAYENLNDSVQLHECEVETYPQPGSSSSTGGYQPRTGVTGTATVLLHPQPSAHMPNAGQASQKKKHHQRQQQQKDDFNLIEPERLSIYRSDSGISNSSYECATPAPSTAYAGGTPPPQKTPKSLKSSAKLSHNSQFLSSSAALAVNFLTKRSPRSSSSKQAEQEIGGITSVPVYMNVDGQPQSQAHIHLERAGSPHSTLVNSSYESASSSQNDGAGGAGSTDPTSLSSCNSLYSSGTGTLVGSAVGKSTVLSRCNRHQRPAEITTPEECEQYQLGHNVRSASALSMASTVSATASRAKCKKRPIFASTATYNSSGIEPTKFATNPFLAANAAQPIRTTATGLVGDKKPRRQTISDPYAHIRQIADSYDAPHHQADNHSTQSAQPFEATRESQPIRLQQPHPTQRGDNYQQQMLMPHEILALRPPPNARLMANEENLRLRSAEEETFTNFIDGNAGKTIALESRQQTQTQQQQQQQQELDLTTTMVAAGYIVRPMRLPLRKHHSFHFQPSQTVAGIRNTKLQQLRMQMQDQQPRLPPVKPPKRYADQGPLVFRPLALNENRAFKPISPPQIENPEGGNSLKRRRSFECDDGEARLEEDEKSEMSEELADEIVQITNASFTLHPAASLEALEALTKSNPDLVYSSQPGSRQNLQQQLAIPIETPDSSKHFLDKLRAQLTSEPPDSKCGANEVEDDDEDLGYSFCEDVDDEDEKPTEPIATVIIPVNRNGAGQVKYVMRQTYREVNI